MHPRHRKLRFESLAPRQLLAADLSVVVEIPGDLQVTTGGQIVVPIMISDSDGITSTDIKLSYDTDVLDTSNAQVWLGDAWSGATLISNVNDSAGTINLAVFQVSECGAGEHSLVLIQFDVTSQALGGSTTAIDLTSVAAYQGDGGRTPLDPSPQTGLDPTDGIITILPNGPVELTQLRSTVVKTPTPIDPVTGALLGPSLPSESWIDEWSVFYLELWTDPSEFSAACTSFEMDLCVETDYFTFGDPTASITFGPAVPENQSTGTVSEEGSLLGVSGSVAIGSDGISGLTPVLLARVRLEPNPANPAGVFVAAEAEYVHAVPDDQVWLAVCQATLEFVNASTVSGSVAPPETQLWPVPYDINDDGRISVGDLAAFASVYGATVGDSSRSGPVGVSDFDHSGTVGVGDLALFAANYGKRPGDEISFASNFPADWIEAPALMLARTTDEVAADGGATLLTEEELSPVASFAIMEHELSTDTSIQAASTITDSAHFDSVAFTIADLPGDQLAAAMNGVIVLDVNAAGYGWFIDPSPWDNDEFAASNLQAVATSDAYGHVDLLTVIRHELGHLEGRPHESLGLMSPTLPLGTRRLDSLAPESSLPPLAENANDLAIELEFPT